MDEEEKVALEKINEFLGEEVEQTEELETENAVDDDTKEDTKKTETPKKKLGKYEFIYTDDDNVLMSREAYEQLMSKYFGQY